MKITGPSKRYVKLIGNASDPSKVVLDLRKLRSPRNQQAVLINAANEVTLQGFTAIGYKGNGFFVTNATGYTFANLRAMLGGVYGIYAFNTIGGTMRDSTAAWNNDGGFYIGQTPPQAKPVRTIVSNVEAYGNVIGWSGTNMRYVTISKSRFDNNGTGLIPQRADVGEVPAGRGQRHHRQRHLLEQLQLLQRSPVRGAPARGERRRLTRPAWA